MLSLLAYLEPDNEDIQDIRKFEASGNATELSAAWLDVGAEEAPFAAAFTFDDLEWPERLEENWGFKGLAGFASITPEGGVINLAPPEAVTVTASDVFAKDLSFDTFTGTLGLKRAGRQFEVRINKLDARGEDLSAKVQGTVYSDPDPSLTLDLNIAITRLAPAQMDTLLPSPIFPDEFNQWLAKSVKGGSVDNLRIGLKGRVRDLAVKPDDDSVVVAGQMNQIKLAFAPGWPAFDALTGPFEVKRGRLSIEPATAKLFKTDIAGGNQ